jgi:hypothetical protein
VVCGVGNGVHFHLFADANHHSAFVVITVVIFVVIIIIIIIIIVIVVVVVDVVVFVCSAHACNNTNGTRFRFYQTRIDEPRIDGNDSTID